MAEKGTRSMICVDRFLLLRQNARPRGQCRPAEFSLLTTHHPACGLTEKTAAAAAAAKRPAGSKQTSESERKLLRSNTLAKKTRVRRVRMQVVVFF